MTRDEYIEQTCEHCLHHESKHTGDGRSCTMPHHRSPWSSMTIVEKPCKCPGFESLTEKYRAKLDRTVNQRVDYDRDRRRSESIDAFREHERLHR